MNFVKFFSLLVVVLFLLFSCTHTNRAGSLLDQLSSEESSLKTRSEYNSYLALEYLQFARNLASVKDNKNAQFFAKKGLETSHGEIVIPENPITWKADPAQIEEMILMQKRLELVLIEPQLKFYLPIQLAHLTYLYDCWVSRESKAVFRVDELAQCRTRFSKLLDEIERYTDDLKKDKQPKVEIKDPEIERFEILFDLNVAKLNDKGLKDMLKVLKYLESLNGNYRILVVGNADRVGIELYNQTLALNRAEVIRDYLIKNGAFENLVELRSFGEDFPDIVTKNGSQQQLNRAVGIYVLKGYATFSSFPLPLLENYIYKKEVMRARDERGLKN
jgi:outer membrane protein OmpA-like peptidoglycan-associated protein